MAVTVKDHRAASMLAEVGVTRVAAVAATLILAITIQSTLLASATLLGVIPQLALVVIVSFAFLDGERVGVVTGFFGGLIIDMLLPQSIVGLSALVYTLIGYGVGSFRQFTTGESVWTPVLVVAVASCVAELSYALLAIMFGQAWVSISDTGKVAGLVVLYNVLLTPFVFPVVRRIANRFRPERVYR
jgi:rod shape-determining protein MreD